MSKRGRCSNGKFVSKSNEKRRNGSGRRLSTNSEYACDAGEILGEIVETTPVKHVFDACITLEHNYCLHNSQTRRSAFPTVHNVNVVKEEIVHTEDSDNHDDDAFGHIDFDDECEYVPSLQWKEGRRIVELGVFVDHLSKGCKKCVYPLNVTDCVGETKHGLGGWLHIICRNPLCHTINYLLLGKHHGRIWDVNTKYASGCYQFQLIILTIRSGPCRCNLNNEHCRLKVAVDAGWQTRGSGRGYNSLSGRRSMIGAETGTIVAYSVRCKKCRKCEAATRLGLEIGKHDCRKKWTGSAKAMEPDMVEELARQMEKSSAPIGTLIGDEDSSTIARLKKMLTQLLKKKSDSNHVKKNLGNQLYALKDTHKVLTVKVIRYLQKCFNYMVNKQLGLSPGTFSTARALQIDKENSKRRTESQSRDAKKRRLELKEKKTSIHDIDYIPAAQLPPNSSSG
uniref:Uncharacterized protein LOC102805567 n=1 Tax=Saccoglossus kowalevskii TaxID=10224 RepID=A0ABM0MX90_SACKO|nr:PREDICTED: uncharacterized protein LOC102805567 [Saccoglossus kowalevskii]